MAKKPESTTDFPRLAEAFCSVGKALYGGEWTGRCLGLSHGDNSSSSNFPILFDPDDYEFLEESVITAIKSPELPFELATPDEVEAYNGVKLTLINALWNEELEYVGIFSDGTDSSPPKNVWKDISGKYQIVITDSRVRSAEADVQSSWEIFINPKSLKKLISKIERQKNIAGSEEEGVADSRKKRSSTFNWDYLLPFLEEKWRSISDGSFSKKAQVQESVKLVIVDLKKDGWTQTRSGESRKKVIPAEDTMERKLIKSLETTGDY
jgi:hypothetical protein